MFNYPVSKGISWQVRKDGSYAVTVRSLEDLYYTVEKETDTETAIEVESWAEQAAPEEVFEIRDLVIEVVDERD